MGIIGNPNSFPVGTNRPITSAERNAEKAVDAAEKGLRKGIEIKEEINSSHPGFNPADWIFPADAETLEAPANPADWGNLENWVKTRVEQGENIDPNLVQVGNTPIWRSSNDPVEPWDCERWPNSPYCGGMGLDLPTARALLSSTIGGSYSLSSTGCETCVTYQPVFLGIPGPISRVCYRKDDEFCSIPSVPQAIEPPIYPPGQRQPLVPIPIAPPGKVRFLYCCNAAYRKVSVNGAVVDNLTYLNESHQSELNELKLAAISSYANGNKISDFEYREYFIEPGIIRCSFDSFSTVGPYLVGRAELMQDFEVLPWQRLDTDIRTWFNYNYIQRYSYSKLRRLNNSASTAGYANLSLQTTNYPPLSESIETISDGIQVSITVNEAYSDLAVVWIVDVNCSVFDDPLVTYESIADYYREQIESIARISFGFEGKGEPTIYDATANNFFVNEPASNWLEFVQIAASAECPIPPIDPPLPQEPNDMDCCDEVLEQLDLIKLRLGVDEFPVKAPSNLAIKNAPQVNLDSHVHLWEWLARNLDGLIGEFPLTVQIEDTDPTTKGNQTEEIELPNIAETLAELFGLVYQSEIKTDLLSEMMMRLIPEVVAAKNAAIVGQSYSKANASYLGYRGALEHTEIPSNFNLDEIEYLPQFLKESKGKLLVFKDKDKTTLQDTFDKLLFAAHIIKSVFYVSGSDKDRLIDAVTAMLDDEENNLTVNKQDWQDWVNKINKKSHRENEPHRQKPFVDQIDIQGDVDNGTI